MTRASSRWSTRRSGDEIYFPRLPSAASYIGASGETKHAIGKTLLRAPIRARLTVIIMIIVHLISDITMLEGIILQIEKPEQNCALGLSGKFQPRC